MELVIASATPPVNPPTVVCVGEGMIELAGPEDAMRLGFGGDVMNTAIYLARLGCEVAFATALGRDPYSDRLVRMLETEGVRTTRIVRDEARIPGLYLIRTDADGERTFHYWRQESAARALFRSARLGAWLANVGGAADVAYVSGITLSLMDGQGHAAMAGWAERVRQDGGAVAFDTNYRPRGWPTPTAARDAIEHIAPHVSTALPTFEDDAALFGDATPEACARRWRAWGADAVVVKTGQDGAYLDTDGQQAWIEPPERVTPVDTTGAGDSFNAGFLAARLGGAEPKAAAIAGHALAGTVIRHRGAIIPRDQMGTGDSA